MIKTYLIIFLIFFNHFEPERHKTTRLSYVDQFIIGLICITT